MNRGSDAHGVQCSQSCGASMRPRFMNRGSARFDEEREEVCFGFNEAPIHESGKSSYGTVPQLRAAALQ